MFVYIVDSILLLVLLPYTFWNWHIALSGKTNIEIAKGLYQDREDRNKSKDDIDEIKEQHYD